MRTYFHYLLVKSISRWYRDEKMFEDIYPLDDQKIKLDVWIPVKKIGFKIEKNIQKNYRVSKYLCVVPSKHDLTIYWLKTPKVLLSHDFQNSVQKQAGRFDEYFSFSHIQNLKHYKEKTARIII